MVIAGTITLERGQGSECLSATDVVAAEKKRA
jgi:hypothetical protein